LFGATAWNGSDNLSLDGAYIDTYISYRHTDVLGMGISTFINDMRINSEIALFQTSDKLNDDNGILRDFNGNIDDICDDNQSVFDFENPVDCEKSIIAHYGLGSKAKYFQYLFEFEYPDLIFEITLIGQFLKYKLLNISNGLHPSKFPGQFGGIDFTSKNNFIPALGSPIFMFTMHEDEDTGTMYMHDSSVFYLNAKRFFMDNNLETNLRTFYDIINHGNLIEIEFKYNLSNKINISTAINKISGNSNLNNSYTFNTMETFSHFRLEATYNF